MDGDKSGKQFEGDWDQYWRNARLAESGMRGGPQDVALERFWLEFFRRRISENQSSLRMLDIGAGDGAVTAFAAAAMHESTASARLETFSLDYSSSALAELRKRNPPGIFCVAADATRCPFPDAAFDLVTSQFGIEYAGTAALTEAARLIRPGGTLAAVLHMRDGGIYRECATNLEAINAVRGSKLLARFKDVFDAAVAVRTDPGAAARLHEADRELAGSVAATEQVFTRFGRGVASGLLFRLYQDIGHMYRQLDAYDPSEVAGWIGLMDGELSGYAGRMTSMLEAAFTWQQLDAVASRLAQLGLELTARDTLKVGNPPQAAGWILVAQRCPI